VGGPGAEIVSVENASKALDGGLGEGGRVEAIEETPPLQRLTCPWCDPSLRLTCLWCDPSLFGLSCYSLYTSRSDCKSIIRSNRFRARVDGRIY